MAEQWFGNPKIRVCVSLGTTNPIHFMTVLCSSLNLAQLFSYMFVLLLPNRTTFPCSFRLTLANLFLHFSFRCFFYSSFLHSTFPVTLSPILISSAFPFLVQPLVLFLIFSFSFLIYPLVISSPSIPGVNLCSMQCLIWESFHIPSIYPLPAFFVFLIVILFIFIAFSSRRQLSKSLSQTRL